MNDVSKSGGPQRPIGAQVLIHIGPPKAASSSIQAGLASLAASGKINFVRVQHPAIAHTACSGWSYDRRVWDDVLLDPAIPNVISSETLWGPAWVGFLGGQEIARRLHAEFPQATIVIVERDDESWLASMFDQYRREGGRRTKGFLFAEPVSSSQQRIEPLRTEQVVVLYDSLGFEVIRVKLASALEGICAVLGIDCPPMSVVNRRPGRARMAFISQGLNRLISTPLSRGVLNLPVKVGIRVRTVIERPGFAVEVLKERVQMFFRRWYTPQIAHDVQSEPNRYD